MINFSLFNFTDASIYLLYFDACVTLICSLSYNDVACAGRYFFFKLKRKICCGQDQYYACYQSCLLADKNKEELMMLGSQVKIPGNT